MKVYISGPISGKTNLNRVAFSEAVDALRALGVETVNPHEIDCDVEGRPFSSEARWLAYMRADIKVLVDCDAVFMLDGWQFSRGATIEAALARDLGLRVFYSLDAVKADREMAIMEDYR